MNKKGHPESLVAAHSGNLNAVKSGAHSPRLIEARAREIVDDLGITDEVDETGRIALSELARLEALIEAIGRDLGEPGLTDRNGKERYLLQRRERYSHRLMEVSDRVHEARVRSRRQEALSFPEGIVGEQIDYVRQLQIIALGRNPDARVSEILAALKLLTDLGPKGSTSYYDPKAIAVPYPDDLEFQEEIAKLKKEREAAEKAGHLNRLRIQDGLVKITG